LIKLFALLFEAFEKKDDRYDECSYDCNGNPGNCIRGDTSRRNGWVDRLLSPTHAVVTAEDKVGVVSSLDFK
jgi:hypothetical protein